MKVKILYLSILYIFIQNYYELKKYEEIYLEFFLSLKMSFIFYTLYEQN